MSFDVQFPGLGLEFTINRVALSIGGFNIYWYGVIIAVALAWGYGSIFPTTAPAASTRTA